LRIGPRDALLAEAKQRVAALKDRDPDAQVYGEDQLGGLGLLLVLTEKPAVLGLLEEPKIPSTITLWQDVVQPATAGLTGIAVAASGLAFIIARRMHRKELRDRAGQQEHAPDQPSAHPSAAGPETSDAPDDPAARSAGKDQPATSVRRHQAPNVEKTGGA
jgi:hypothetical protein